MQTYNLVRVIDEFLNGITMYRLILYFLVLLLLVVSVNQITVLFSAAFLIMVCWATNTIFAKVFKAPTNFESVYITALILVFIITPIRTFKDLPFFFLIATLAMASKYILAINKKHLFNPAAFAVFFSAITLNYSASWWIGMPFSMPVVAIGGLLIARKIRRFSLIFSFLATSLVIFLGFSGLKVNDVLLLTQEIILNTPILFFMFVMLTEPQTTPPTKKLQIIYGSLVGLLFAQPFHVGSFYLTPEIALLSGNVFSYIVSPKEKLFLKLKKKVQIAPDIYDFIFELDKKMRYIPGQYMEWTLAHKNPDSRGNRRYFTCAASPTEGNLRIGAKFYPKPSSFKEALRSLDPGGEIVASQLAGEFILPKDPGKKLVFIAGGIGITPFRSMIKFLCDTNQKRDIILLFSNKSALDIVYKDIFDLASQKLGIKTVYTITNTTDIPPGWAGRVGYIDDKLIREEVPAYKDRIFYISGPHSMVDAFEETLRGMGLRRNQIKIDFFPGYA